MKIDVAVVGGGMVGATAASLLSRCGWSVALLDSAPPPSFDEHDPVGQRVSALSPGSSAILREAGVWDAIEASRHCDYGRMHVEDGERALDFEAASFGLQRLGTIVENELVRDRLWQTLNSESSVTLFSESPLQSWEQDAHQVNCQMADGKTIQARLLLGCDGPGSHVRSDLGVRDRLWDYGQSAVVARVRMERPNPGVAWQRFLDTGPVALLPLRSGESSLVWTLPAAQAEALQSLDDTTFCEQLSAVTSHWLGTVDQVAARGQFPLLMRLTDRVVNGRAVLLGDAAHVVHPLAGQGANLGLADVATLVECLLEARSKGLALESPAALRRFERWQRAESGVMAAGIHAIGSVFRMPWLQGARGLGLALVSGNWWLRDAFLQRAAGQGPNAPALSRGVKLTRLLEGAA